MGGGFCLLTTQATEAFSLPRINEVDPALFAAGTDVVDAAARMNLGTPEERDFLATYPPEMLERLRDAIARALAATPRTPIVFTFVLGRERSVDVGALLAAAPLQVTVTGPEH